MAFSDASLGEDELVPDILGGGDGRMLGGGQWLQAGSAKPRVVEWLKGERLDKQPAECGTVKSQRQKNSMDEEELPPLPDPRVHKVAKRQEQWCSALLLVRQQPHPS